MNINLRALVFGTAVAAALVVTMNVVSAAEAPQVVRLYAVDVIAHRDIGDAAGADGNPSIVRLAPVIVTAHKAATV